MGGEDGDVVEVAMVRVVKGVLRREYGGRGDRRSMG